MANTDRARKLLVRTALVTSTTIATLIGAQMFAMLDAQQFQPTETPAPDNVVVIPAATQTPLPITHRAPEITILHSAPSITILRQPGQATATVAQAVETNVTAIQPPAPSQIVAPQPVVIQQPAPHRSRSSR